MKNRFYDKVSGGKSALVVQSIVAYEDIEEKDRVALLLSPDQVDLESANFSRRRRLKIVELTSRSRLMTSSEY